MQVIKMNTDLFSRLQYEPAIVFLGDDIEEIDDESEEETMSLSM